MKLSGRVWKFMVLVLVGSLLFTTIAFSAEAIMLGTLESAEEGIVLTDAKGERFVVFGKDLSNLVGKTVQVTGSVEEGPYGKSIRVTTVQKVKD